MDKYKNIKTKENYTSLLNSGMFWEFHPELTGNWKQDNIIINPKDKNPNSSDCGFQYCDRCKYENKNEFIKYFDYCENCGLNMRQH
jgi:hypothetical protein